MGAVGSGAGSSFLQQYILKNVTAPTAVATPLLAYGSIGLNDSGGYCSEGRAFSKAVVTLEQVGSTALSGISVSIYGATAPNASQTWWNAIQGKNNYGLAVPLPVQGFTNATGYMPGVNPSSWFLLPGPSEQTGTGTSGNPLTPTTPLLNVNMPLTAIRAVVTTSSAPAGCFHVSVMWIP